MHKAADRIRNVALVGHRGSGKTSVHEALLFEAGATNRLGSVLDATLAVRTDAPYACKGGVCGTCRAKLVEGEVSMARRYALDDDEVDEGFVLACQSVPLTSKVVLDFDA